MTPAERKMAERQRKRAAGLVPVEIWAPPQYVDAIKAIAAWLAKLDDGVR